MLGRLVEWIADRMRAPVIRELDEVTAIVIQARLEAARLVAYAKKTDVRLSDRRQMAEFWRRRMAFAQTVGRPDLEGEASAIYEGLTNKAAAMALALAALEDDAREACRLAEVMLERYERIVRTGLTVGIRPRTQVIDDIELAAKAAREAEEAGNLDDLTEDLDDERRAYVDRVFSDLERDSRRLT